MRKLFLAAAALLSMTVVAEAQHRYYRQHHYPSARQHYYPQKYNAAPWIAGAVGLGVLGALTYDAWGRPYRPFCWNEYIGLDRYGQQVYQQRCE